MKRAFYEWGAITTSTMALVCFVYWMASRTSPIADFELFLPLGHWNSMQIFGANGQLTINDHRGSLEAIEEISKAPIVNPPLTSNHRCELPGLSYQSIDWGATLTWSLRLSMWIPTVLMSLAAVFFIHGYVRVRRQALQRLQTGREPRSLRGLS
jgi:hypothetical protein